MPDRTSVSRNTKVKKAVSSLRTVHVKIPEKLPGIAYHTSLISKIIKEHKDSLPPEHSPEKQHRLHS